MSETKKVDLVIVIDTSGSMKDTAEEISNAIAGAVDEARSSCPSDLRVDYLGMEGTFANTKFDKTVRNYLTQKVGVDAKLLKSRLKKSLPGSGAQEDGARAVEDVSEHYDWREGAERAVFVLQDESLDGGEMVVTPAAIKANDNTIATALQHNVKVHTYLGAPHSTLPYPTKQDEENMIEEFKRLASKTGGEHFIHTSGMANFKDVLKKTICASKVPQEESIEEKEKPCGCKDYEDRCVSQRWEGYLPAVQEKGIGTGIQVKKGEVIDILASGFATYGPGYPLHGPQGDAGNSFVGKLHVKIGDVITPIGTGVMDWSATSDGEIIFLYGDVGHYNNEGGFDIKLKVAK
ncbi:MAG TPA: LecA/PA-IL family lectin [Pseudosphingobacterium sp.]|nr:LecA/PA-IL family lectin [Pseudosphingobacterium sp.]